MAVVWGVLGFFVVRLAGIGWFWLVWRHGRTTGQRELAVVGVLPGGWGGSEAVVESEQGLQRGVEGQEAPAGLSGGADDLGWDVDKRLAEGAELHA